MATAPGVLLGGPSPTAGPESLASHTARFGPLRATRDLLAALDEAGLTGRGGGAFPVARKWRSVAGRGGDRRVLVNGAEGDPLSTKDATLMASRPHLVIDGAQLAASAIGASEIVLYVGAHHRAALRAMTDAVAERHGRGKALHAPMRIVASPDAYVAGEETAAVHFINDGDARPTSTPPRPYERGIAGRPTLVQNVETLARVALIARAETRNAAVELAGQTLVTVSTPAGRTIVEAGTSTTLGELAGVAGADFAGSRAVLVGGYYGRWTTPITAWSLPLDAAALRRAGLALGAGMVTFIGRTECGVALTARMVDYLSGQSSAQCGPCVFGLRAIADTLRAVAARRASAENIARLERWRSQLTGRGACHHPDGAAGLLGSAMSVFADEFDVHARRRRCTAPGASAAA